MFEGNNTMVRFVLDPKVPPRLSHEQEARLAAMTQEEIEANASADVDNPPLNELELLLIAKAR
jgi:putative transcriptional regulator